MAPVCPDIEKKIENFKFIRVFNGTYYCTYVCEHTDTVAESQTSVNCTISEVLSLCDMNATPIESVFCNLDFDCVTDGKLVPLSFVRELLNDERLDRKEIMEQVLNNAFLLEREVGRNDIMKQLFSRH